MLEDIRKREFHSILADESSDGSKKEKLSFSVRTCTDDYKVFEDFVGIFECVERFSSDSCLKYANDILLRSQLNGIKMVAMAFDGTNAMKSLSRKIKDSVIPNAIIYVHCFAHCNDLIVKDAIKQWPIAVDIIGFMPSLIRSCVCVPQTQEDFRHENDTRDYKVLQLHSLSATRWTTRVKQVMSFLTKHV